MQNRALKKIVRTLFLLLHKMPILRRIGKYGVKKLGLYPTSIRLYERLRVGNAPAPSTAPLDLMPCVVKQIFHNLTGEKQGK